MAMCGLCEPVLRLPYVQLSKAERERGVPLLKAMKEHIPGCKTMSALQDSDFLHVSAF
jgi:4-hydroxy-tetrahydrodipicolinate synthase